jgi:hypothetical protein
MAGLRIACVVALLTSVGGAAAAQVSYSADAVEEIQSISIRVDLTGGGSDGARMTRLLEDVIIQELKRADILFERPDPRSGDCCVLRLDVRLADGSGRGRFGQAYVARLELGFQEHLGSVPTWTTIWAGRVLSNIVERPDLPETLRFVARELAVDFVDLYRTHFPRN